MVTPTATSLPSAMKPGGPATWSGATWIGEIDDQQRATGFISLCSSDGYRFARLLVRSAGVVRGFVDMDVDAGRIHADELWARVDALPPARLSSRPTSHNVSVTAAVSTRDRADQLGELLPTLLELGDAVSCVLVVDNAPSDDSTRKLVDRISDPRLRYILEPRPGLSCGRNRALIEARTPIVAFTDDDVVVDRDWIDRLVEPFVRHDTVGVATGMVPTGELRTPAQLYFEDQTHWLSGVDPEVFRLTDHRPAIRNFPFDVGRYGTGANFAVDRELAIRLGGFNEALGIGSPTHGGEDLDMFLRVLYAGFALAYEPDALVWHRHRADADSLERAVEGYAVSWTAWMTSLVENPVTRRDAVTVGLSHGARRLGALARDRVVRNRRAPRPTADSALGPAFDGLTALSARKLRSGPAAYVRSRRSGRASRPFWKAAAEGRRL